MLTILLTLLEGFEALVLPRRISRPFRLGRPFYRLLWWLWREFSLVLPRHWREDFLAAYGPLSLLMMLTTWGCLLIAGFAGLYRAFHIPLHLPEGEILSFGTYFYLSATTFVTLGFGDISPQGNGGRWIADIEAGIGFGFLAIVVGYLPVLYGAFARREVEIGMLDALASTPPSAGELLSRASDDGADDLPDLLKRWERWAAELLESHLSYPNLMYWRSQHERQSWLGALTAILDTSAIVIAFTTLSPLRRQAKLTFAIARHALVDLRLIAEQKPVPICRLPDSAEDALLKPLFDSGLPFSDSTEGRERFRELRALYEPHLNAIGAWLHLTVPGFQPGEIHDHWRTAADPDDHFFAHTSG
ncbi:MAG: potassium channel family protein [Armatimonas sp.]